MLNTLRSRLLSDATLIPLQRLFRDYAARYWKRYATAVVWMAVGAACVSATAYLLGSAINEAYIARNFQRVIVIAIAGMALYTVKGIATYAQALTIARVSNEITAENQYRLVEKLLNQDLAFFGDRHSSEFTARITYGAGSVSGILAMLITAAGRDLLTLIGLILVMAMRTPDLFLIGFFVMTPAVLTVRRLIRRVRQLAEHSYLNNASLLETLQETIQGLRVVKTLGLEEEMRRSAQDSVTSVLQATNTLARVMNRSTPMMEALAGMAIAFVLTYGGYRVIFLDAAPGEFASFIAAFLLAYEPAKRLARINVDLSSSLVGLKTLFDILDLPDRADHSGKPALKIRDGRVALHDVRFAYRPGEPVLRGLTLSAEPGQVSALVGPSGSGKSTIFNLLLHLYDGYDGEITIDGEAIADVSAKSLRANIAYVGQDIFLFRGSIRKNIAFGRLDASEDEIVAAAQAAHAHEFICQFSAGYDTPVGEHGLQLSTGQRQRIAVARALIRRAPIILLDEPTASLDSESEHYVQAAIRRLSEGRTTLVIAHRLYTITNANVIYFVEKGVVVEAGRHEALLRKGDRYSNFFSKQFGKETTANLQIAAE
jgi:ABC-type multidrug transport system fused ATPase/permease subunit